MTTLELPAGEAHLWHLNSEALALGPLKAACESLITEAERARRDRYSFEKGKRQELLTRALIRLLLSQYHPKVDPKDWCFEAGPHGRPDVSAPVRLPDFSFNLSHTDGAIVCLVARGCVVGVDVECTDRARQAVKLADRYFAPSEVTALQNLPEAEQPERFFTYWTLKEAYIKAKGVGLAIPLDQFAFDLDGEQTRIRFDPSLQDDPQDWQFLRTWLSPRHALAAALQRGRNDDLQILRKDANALLAGVAADVETEGR